MKDKIGNFIINTTKFFVPSCRYSHISINYLPVFKSYLKETHSSIYVIKVIVKQGDSSRLYSISDYVYESYFRAGAQTIQLRADDISKEINKRSRGKSSIVKMKNEDFIDKEPEIYSPFISPIHSPRSKSSFHIEQDNRWNNDKRPSSPNKLVDYRNNALSYVSTSPTKSFNSDQDGIFPLSSPKEIQSQSNLLNKKRNNRIENGINASYLDLDEPVAIPLNPKDFINSTKPSKVARKIAKDIINLED